MKQVFTLVMLLTAASLLAQTPRLIIPRGHTAEVSTMAISPDGKFLLTGSLDYTAKLWNLDGKEIQSFEGHSAGITAVVFSPDGKYVLTASKDKTAKLWTLAGKEVQTFKGHTKELSSIAISSDGKNVLSGSLDNTAKLWNLSGLEIQTFIGHTDGGLFSTGITSVAFSPDGKQVLTGAHDKTAKLWDLSGKEIRSFTGFKEAVSTVAFSTDGKRILTWAGGFSSTVKIWKITGEEIQTGTAKSGFFGSAIFSPDEKQVLTTGLNNEGSNALLWDLSGKLLTTFKHPLTGSATFSPDGKYVLTAGADKVVRMWDLAGKEVKTFKGYSSGVNSVAFSPVSLEDPAGGAFLLTGCGDHTAKLWDVKRNQISCIKGHTGEVLAAVFSPDGNFIATASIDTSARLWNLAGNELQVFRGSYRGFSSVVFSPDGKHILTGSQEWEKNVQLWDFNGKPILSFKGIDQSIHTVAYSPDGQYIMAGGDPVKGKIWNKDGSEFSTFFADGLGIGAVAFSPDSKSILFGSSNNTAQLTDIRGTAIQTLKGHTSLYKGLVNYITSPEGVSAVAFSPDGQVLATGSEDNTIKFWDLNGREIRTLKGHGKKIRSLAFSSNGKLLLSGCNDQTSKLWDVNTGEELATLFSINTSDWVVTTPSGLFDASADAMKMMHYMVGLEVVELEQLKERYYEPGLLAKIMGFSKGELRNVASFNQVAMYPELKASIENGQLNISLTERKGGLGKLSLFINGKEVKEDLNPTRQKKIVLSLNTFSKFYQTGIDNTIGLRVYNAEGWLKSQAYELAYRPSETKPEGTPAKANSISDANPHLYTIVVGTSDYAGNRLDLRFADQDALAISQALKQSGSALFGVDGVSISLLSSAGKTAGDMSSKSNIEKAFKDFATQAKPADVLVVYFSGHGFTYGDAEKAQFYYLTKDIGSEDLSDPVVRKNYTISSEEFTQWLTAIPAQKQVMILDACNAGKVVESLAAFAQKSLDPSQIRALDRMKDRTGMFVLTGSAADKVSYEASQYGQGLLTYSLLQGMSGLALTEDKRVDVMKLFQYARDRVPELAKGIGGVQTPVLAFPESGASFDIGIVTEQVKIPLAQVKPVFIRNVFQDEASFDDVLGVTGALEQYFRKITAKGALAELIFVDVKEYDNAYSMKGRYTVKGEEVELRGRLFKGKESQGEFQVTGKKSDLTGLAAAILEQVSGMMK